MFKGQKAIFLVTMSFFGVLVSFSQVMAYNFSSTNYKIDASVTNNFGGSQSSASYKLVGSGGESIIGNGTSGSYKIGVGYIQQLYNNATPTITLSTQPSGVVGYWPLDENTGSTFQDNSINTSSGTLFGTPTWAAGKLSYGVTFNGTTSQYASVGNASALQATTITVSGWVKTTATPAASPGSVIVGKSSAWALTLTPGQVGLYNYANSSRVCGDATTVTDGQWHYVAATIQSGVTNGTKLYVDGALKQTCTLTMSAQTNNVNIGGFSGSGGLNGTIDHVKMYNRVLTLDEIQAEYQAQNSGSSSGVSLGTVIAGASNSTLLDSIVKTNTASYTLSVNQNNNLTSGANTIPAISSTIASPAAWSEGVTKGLGFSLSATNASAIPAGWGSGNNFAAFPSTATTFYTRSGLQSSKDYVTMKLRLDVANNQASTVTPYTNTITITGTTTP